MSASITWAALARERAPLRRLTVPLNEQLLGALRRAAQREGVTFTHWAVSGLLHRRRRDACHAYRSASSSSTRALELEATITFTPSHPCRCSPRRRRRCTAGLSAFLTWADESAVHVDRSTTVALVLVGAFFSIPVWRAVDRFQGLPWVGLSRVTVSRLPGLGLVVACGIARIAQRLPDGAVSEQHPAQAGGRPAGEPSRLRRQIDLAAFR
ncbi:MAG: hypothetical protein WAM30_16940 [Candidatus Dormiibacterota bacterium]